MQPDHWCIGSIKPLRCQSAGRPLCLCTAERWLNLHRSRRGVFRRSFNWILRSFNYYIYIYCIFMYDLPRDYGCKLAYLAYWHIIILMCAVRVKQTNSWNVLYWNDQIAPVNREDESSALWVTAESRTAHTLTLPVPLIKTTDCKGQRR